MDEFLKEYATFRYKLNAALAGLDEDVVVNLYAIYRKDVCRARMDETYGKPAGAGAEKPVPKSREPLATPAQMTVLQAMLDEGTLPQKYAAVLTELSKQEASELISKFGTKRR